MHDKLRVSDGTTEPFGRGCSVAAVEVLVTLIEFFGHGPAYLACLLAGALGIRVVTFTIGQLNFDGFGHPIGQTVTSSSGVTRFRFVWQWFHNKLNFGQKTNKIEAKIC